MSAALVRVINLQVLPRSILLDKIDRTSGQFETDLTYAQTGKQAVYVPRVNAADPTVNGYIDLVPTDEVLLQVNQPHGVIVKLAAKGYVSYFAHSGTLTVAPVVTGAAHIVAKTGSNGVFALASGGFATFTDTTANAFASSDVGSPITVSGSIHGSNNNGTFEITAFGSSTHVTVANPNAIVDTAVDTWTTPGGVSITGTTLLSLTPDHTYVTVTNTSGTKFVVTDTAIIAAGGMVTTTELFVPNSLVTGTITTGWTVTVQANSKISNTFTVS